MKSPGNQDFLITAEELFHVMDFHLGFSHLE